MRQFIPVFISIIALACSQKTPEKTDNADLLLSNEIQRIAHMENDAQLLVTQIADSMRSISGGEISSATNDEIRERFEVYFNRVKYTSWDDVRPPEIFISQDGKSASVSVQKFLDIQSLDSGTLGPHQYTLFAWNAQYHLIEDEWKIVENTSTSKTLTGEQAANLAIRLSTVYAEINERDLIPEGVAHDNNTGTTYLSSTYKQKILAINSDGLVSDFKAEKEDGLWSTVGMEVDETRKTLWVVSFSGNEVLPMKYPEAEQQWKSKIYAYSVPNGELRSIYEPDIEGKIAFNDLCVDSTGNVYISESFNAAVYRLDPSTGEFKNLEIDHEQFVFPNGMTLSADNAYLYIATSNGIFQYRFSDNSYRLLSAPEGVASNRLDGLAFYKGTLIGNQSYLKRIVQYSIKEPEGAIKHQRILESNNPLFDQPATGEIAGDNFIYLANAQMRSAFDKGSLKAPDSLETVKLLTIELPQTIIPKSSN